MAVASKLMAIGLIALSLMIGLLTFYIYSDIDEKKKYVEEFISQFINFIIFIWIGKIVLHINVFLKDPLSILAYPSDSQAFYFAVVAIGITLIFKSIKRKMNVVPLVEVFVYVFLIGSFVFEFIQYVVEGRTSTFWYLLLLAALIAFLFFLTKHMDRIKIWMVLLTSWSIGVISLSNIYPFVTVFGYMMAPWFVSFLFISAMIGIIYILRKRDE